MKNLNLLILVINEINELLITVGEPDWSDAFNKFRQKCNDVDSENLKDLRVEILRLYGGMGSFNDLVLYKQGQPMLEENKKLDALRKELFNIVRDA
jgi:hypothetical protein